MKSTAIRAASAFIAIGILWLTHNYLGRDGIAMISSLAAVAFIAEFSNLLPGSRSVQVVFALTSSALMYVGVFASHLLFLEMGLSFILLNLVVLAKVGRSFTIDQALKFMSYFSFGLFYCAILPLFIFKVLYIGEDLSWFVFYLAMVFIGDTVAYLVGINFGKTKLLESVSPKKSVEGAVAGLLATVATAMVGSHYFAVPLWQLALAGLAVSCVAQAGDLVESLLKRVAHVKDSGQLMPGHGGMMDRLDGIYFAGPVFYWFLTQWTTL